MTVIIFLLDNTPSMLQQTIMHGVRHSYIDIAKQTVELFLEQRESDAERKDDRYMLLTYDKPPNHVKAGWKEHMDQFRNALNTLQCTGSVSESNALNNVFDLLNQERVMVGMDTYGYGRCPFNNMFSFIVLITNYRHYPYVFSTPMPSLCPKMDGSQLTKEPYRWDQRFFALILGGSKYSPYIEKMTHVMGGWYMLIRSKKTWDLSIAKLLKSIQFRLIVNVVHETGQYARIDETTITSLQPTSCAIVYCEKSWKGSWPFPESEWSYMRQNDLLPRLAFPEIRILPVCCDEPIWMVDFPVDKYELQQRSSSGNRISLPSNDQGKVWPV
uniref:VWFA domain-containing protein n=1 Tax=Anopheles minimus TaxID=112268 RepID=A0A182WPQ4_9DIPT